MQQKHGLLTRMVQNHCQSRKVPHLCQFGVKKPAGSQESPPNSASDSRSRKRSLQDADEQSLPFESAQDVAEDGLKAWGYMPGHVHYSLGRADTEVRFQGMAVALN